jgi:radical SAM protein with 4Fe4S-binding SPASM domain
MGLPLLAGNIRRERLRDIWKVSMALRAIREIRKKDLSDCAGCDARPYCYRCPGMALQEAGDMRRKVPFACTVAHLKKKVAASL